MALLDFGEGDTDTPLFKDSFLGKIFDLDEAEALILDGVVEFVTLDLFSSAFIAIELCWFMLFFFLNIFLGFNNGLQLQSFNLYGIEELTEQRKDP